MIKGKDVEFPRVESREVFFNYTPYKFANIPKKSPLHQALIDPKTGHVYSIPSDKYRLLKHEDYMTMVEDILLNLELGDIERDVVFYNHGAKMRACYKMMDLSYRVGNLNDTVFPSIIITNGYDLDWGYSFDLGAYRKVCANGLVIGENLIKIAKKHISNFNQEKISDSIMGGLDQFDEVVDLWNIWKRSVVDIDMYETTMNKAQFTRKEREEIENVIEVSSSIKIDFKRTKTLSYWKFFNIVMQYITHNVQGFRREELMKQTRSAFYGEC